MEAKELRISNLVSFKGKWTGEVSELREVTLSIKNNGGVFTYDQFEGIPLTEEWLVKMCFVEMFEEHINPAYGIIDGAKQTYKIAYFKKGFFTIKRYERIESGSEVKGWTCTCFDEPVPCGIWMIEYVHQLQNLYFALTGEELELK